MYLKQEAGGKCPRRSECDQTWASECSKLLLQTLQIFAKKRFSLVYCIPLKMKEPEQWHASTLRATDVGSLTSVRSRWAAGSASSLLGRGEEISG